MREEIRGAAAPRPALVTAVTRVGQAISYSTLTVAAALLTLLLAPFAIYRGLGPALAIGIAVLLATEVRPERPDHVRPAGRAAARRSLIRAREILEDDGLRSADVQLGGLMVEPRSSEGWDGVLGDLERRRQAARAMGGEERLRRHREAGKLDARSRIGHLLDPGSFQELGTLVGGEEAPADAVVMGSGRIDGRPVMVAAEDFTVKAGTISQAANSKRYRAAELAACDRVTLVMMLEGAGFRADGRSHARVPTDLLAQARCSGRVPLVTAVLGASAGHGALVAPMSDFTVMSRHASIFTAGPPVVQESLGETITKEDLGGPAVALSSGLIHNGADDDAGALDLGRTYLRYFPSSPWSYPPGVADGDG